MEDILANPSLYYWLIILSVWTIPWKGVALWRSARNGQLGWFTLLLIFNTLAILDIIYIFAFSKKKRSL